MSIKFQDKENRQQYLPEVYRPTHQGRAFKIQLGHNNGPYLAKDIMHSNKKSTYLLAAKQVLQSQMSMSNMMTILSKQQQTQSKLIRNSSQVQNWFSKCNFLQGQINYIQQQSKKLSQQQTKLKIQIKHTFSNLITQNQQLCQSFLPLFRNLLRAIRQQNNEQKNIFEETKRDIEELTKFRNQYLDALVDCERRIMDVEGFLGIGGTGTEGIEGMERDL